MVDFFVGDDGVVITVVDPGPSESLPTTENVIQFNWVYDSPPDPPYGEYLLNRFASPSIVHL